MRIPVSKDVDLATLAEQLKTVLGRGVALSARMPGQVDDEGNLLPGVLVVLDAATGEPLDLPASVVTAIETAIVAHILPPKTKTPAKALAEALTTAATAAELRAALTAYARVLVDREDRVRGQRAR